MLRFKHLERYCCGSQDMPKTHSLTKRYSGSWEPLLNQVSVLAPSCLWLAQPGFSKIVRSQFSQNSHCWYLISRLCVIEFLMAYPGCLSPWPVFSKNPVRPVWQESSYPRGLLLVIFHLLSPSFCSFAVIPSCLAVFRVECHLSSLLQYLHWSSLW